MAEECAKCKGACCKVLVFDLPDTRMTREYCRARGLKYISGSVVIDHVCPELDEEGRCRRQESKPALCQMFKVSSRFCQFAQRVAP